MSEKATAQDYIALSFEGVPEITAPSRADWMRRAKNDHRTLAKAMSTLRYFSAELAEIIKEDGQFEIGLATSPAICAGSPAPTICPSIT